MKKALTYSTILIALYLGVYYSSGAGTLLSGGANAGTSLVRAFQGR
jgi:hypothetical protein